MPGMTYHVAMRTQRRFNLLSIAICLVVLPTAALLAQNAASRRPPGVDPAGVDPDVLKRTDVTEEAAQSESDKFLTYYYLSPAPDRFVEEFRVIARLCDFEIDANLPALSTFYGMIIRANPARTAAWADALFELPASYRPMLYYSLHLAATTESRDALRRLADKVPDHEQRTVFAILGRPEIDLSAMPIRAGAHLDMLWGAYFATGDQTYVVRVIETLGSASADQQAASMVLARAAEWSLRSNCWQHSKVLAACRSSIERAPAPLAEKLRAIVKDVEEILRTKPCPEPATAAK